MCGTTVHPELCVHLSARAGPFIHSRCGQCRAGHSRGLHVPVGSRIHPASQQHLLSVPGNKTSGSASLGRGQGEAGPSPHSGGIPSSPLLCFSGVTPASAPSSASWEAASADLLCLEVNLGEKEPSTHLAGSKVSGAGQGCPSRPPALGEGGVPVLLRL